MPRTVGPGKTLLSSADAVRRACAGSSRPTVDPRRCRQQGDAAPALQHHVRSDRPAVHPRPSVPYRDTQTILYRRRRRHAPGHGQACGRTPDDAGLLAAIRGAQRRGSYSRCCTASPVQVERISYGPAYLVLLSSYSSPRPQDVSRALVPLGARYGPSPAP